MGGPTFERPPKPPSSFQHPSVPPGFSPFGPTLWLGRRRWMAHSDSSLPPTPMQAMFSTSFGPTPPAHPCRPLAKTPNPATEAPYRNDRRLTDAIMAKFYSVSLECPIATRHSFNDQMGEPYGCILRKPFPPCHIPARDANIKKIEMFLLRIMIGSILGVIRLGCLQQCLGDSSNGRTYGLPVGSARYGARCWAAS